MLGQQNANLRKASLPTATRRRTFGRTTNCSRPPITKPLVVAYRNGAAIRLSDIANVQDGVENIRTAVFSTASPSIPLIILREPGANIIETVDRIKAALPSLKASMPAGSTWTWCSTARRRSARRSAKSNAHCSFPSRS
jgi:multidrug efflux pump